MKKNQYLDYLTNEDIHEMVDRFGYVISKNETLENDYNKVGYDKIYDEEKNVYALRIKCKQKPSENYDGLGYHALSALFKILLPVSYNLDCGVLFINDFLVQEIFANDLINVDNKQDNQKVFANFMVEKFNKQSNELAEQYIEDYNKFIINYNKEIEEQQNDKHEQEMGN